MTFCLTFSDDFKNIKNSGGQSVAFLKYETNLDRF